MQSSPALKIFLQRAAIAVAIVTAAPWSAAPQPAPHFPHEPRFGGVFHALDGDRLHVEGIWSAQRRFKLLVIDASGGPVALEQLRQFEGRVAAGNREVPLVLLEADGYFEARIPTLPLPAVIGVVIRPAPAGSEERLTFAFTDYSIDTSGDATDAPIEVPPTLSGIVDALQRDQQQALALLDGGVLPALSEPEHRIRELVLAMEPHIAGLPEAARPRLEAARASAIRAAWLLHSAFDYGTEAQTRAALTRLLAAVDDIVAAAAGIAR